MKLHMVGCHHQHTSLALRERLAFSLDQTEQALTSWRKEHPHTEAVLLSTCNRVELYAATELAECPPGAEELAQHLADFHDVPVDQVRREIVSLEDEAVVRHLFRVAASLDSMVVGEPQIIAQVKQAYELARRIGSTGPLTHQFFQSALRTARRVAGETALHRHRVSIPSIAIADFANRVFEHFHDKRVLVLGAGEMASETVRYLVDEGVRDIHVANRNGLRATQVAEDWGGRAAAWDDRYRELIEADLVISTTGAARPIVTLAEFRDRVAAARHQRPLLILDLAVPRDFEEAIGDQLGTYLYSIDDLAVACERNRTARAAQLPAAEAIVEDEAARFLAEARHRITIPVISQLREGLQEQQAAELERLYRRLPDLDERTQREIEQFADRLVGKLLHPPLASLRDESASGSPHGLLDALKRLFQLKE